METRFLETFLIVVEQGSLAEAARRLGVTPAAVAQRIQALEAEIGLPLLDRAGRRVRPTDAGHAIIEQSLRIVSDTRQLRTLAQADLPVGQLQLGSISTALTGILPPALRHIFDTMSGVAVFLLPGSSTDLYRYLLEGRIDAAIIVKPPFPLLKTFEWTLLRAERLVLLCPQNLRDRDPHDLLRTQPFIRYDRNNWGGRFADGYLHRAGISPREWLELDSLEAISVMVGNGLGVSIIPDWANPWPEGIQAARLDLPVRSPNREIGILWVRGSPSRRLVSVLIDAIRRSSPET